MASAGGGRSLAAVSHHLWHYLLVPGAAMDMAAAERLRPAMERLARFASPAHADWLLRPVLPAGYAPIPPDEVLRDRLRTRFLRAEARRWLGLIDAAGIELLPLKGFATGLAVYPDPELRGLGDVDLLLRARDLPRLAGWLRDHGFAFRASQGEPIWGHSGDASFDPCVAPDGQVAFDLHIQPDDYPLHRALTVEAVFAAAHPVIDAGMSLRIPCDAHLFLIAASNAARDKLDENAVRSVADMAVMARRGIDWPAMSAILEPYGETQLLRLAAQLLIGLGWPGEGLPPALARAYRGLAGWEMARATAAFADMFAVLPTKVGLQRREWLLTGGLRVAAWRASRRLRGLIKPWPGTPRF